MAHRERGIMTRWCPAPRCACGSLHVSRATLTHRTVSCASGLDGVDVIEYKIINDMYFLVSIFLARLNSLVEVCCQGKTYP